MADEITIERQIACVRRELALRQRVYPKWVAQSKMKQAEADKELATMQAVHDTLTKFEELQMALNPFALAAEFLDEALPDEESILGLPKYMGGGLTVGHFRRALAAFEKISPCL